MVRSTSTTQDSQQMSMAGGELKVARSTSTTQDSHSTSTAGGMSKAARSTSITTGMLLITE